MEIVSLIGILAGLILMIILAYKGHSIIWVAPLCAFVVVLFSVGGLGEGRTLLSAYTVDYMQGAGQYFISWFPTFLLGAIFGKVMDMTGAAQSLANIIVRVIGPRFVVLAVLIPCLALTYGGVSLFVVVFIMYPMGYAIFKAANLPRTLLPGIIVFGSLGITMTAIPGTPQIQNLIPMEFFGTTATAAPVLGIVAAICMGVPGYLYLDRQAKKAKAKGLCFEEDPQFVSYAKEDEVLPSWHWLSGLVPLIVVFVTLNVLKFNIVLSLILGIIVCFLFNIRKVKMLPAALTEGAKGSVVAMMNTACAVGFGSVIKIVPGFVLLTALLVGSASTPVSLLLSETLSAGVLSGATGSASGGVSIALSAFADHYMAMGDALGVSPEILHRIASLAAGALDKLPHNGAVITILTVSHCTHKQSYKDIFVTSVIMPVIIVVILACICGAIC